MGADRADPAPRRRPSRSRPRGGDPARARRGRGRSVPAVRENVMAAGGGIPALRIGGLTVRPPLVLAPMAGICDRHFRLLVRRIGGVGLVSAEFVSSGQVARGIRKELEKLTFTTEERPIAIQIYGRDAEQMAACARVVERLRPDVCDINMGCPANKILKGCAGAALMRDVKRAASIVRACRRELTIPLTVKFRLGIGTGPTPVNYLEFGRMCESEGADAVTLHARTARQMYRGHADWEAIARLAAALSIPVIGNGDVDSPAAALRMLRETGCAGVMIGRAVLENPWIFREAADLLAGRPPCRPRPEERLELIRTHFAWIVRDYEPKMALHKLRTFTGRYARGLPDGDALRRRISALERPEDFIGAIEEHFRALPAGVTA
ncbi:MAG: tRNA-dihydrouridine synthase family protein [Acidobacteria bacterium]|nr:MAG: tRNA-dihydrouridine synthase family protein [Acidobacteriota bacterium]